MGMENLETGSKENEKKRWTGDEKLVIITEGDKDKRSMVDICRKHKISKTFYYLHLLSGATGLEFNETEFLKVEGRIWNRIRLYNNGNGMTRKDDYLPKRFEEPIPDGPHKGHCFTRAYQDRPLDEYYKIRGWDSNGAPTSEKLKELGIDKRTWSCF